MKILITGTAGFIGFHLAKLLIKEGHDVVGLDEINDYYDVKLKYRRLEEAGITHTEIKYGQIAHSSSSSYRFLQADLADHELVVSFMENEGFDYVVNLAAQAGVRYSIEKPRVYTRANVEGFLNILEGSRHSKVKHLIYASTSSVYGLNTSMPLKESAPTEHPMALYAATKKANEMMAHSYSHLFALPTTGLRFFTVYGPWGRPDMALFLFTDAILKDEPIKVFNHGNMIRDFTYVEDIVESIRRLLPKPPKPDPNWNDDKHDSSSSSAPYQIFNIGNSSPVKLMDYIEALELALGKKAIKKFMPMQPGDVPATHACTQKLEQYVDYKPSTEIKHGVAQFVDWYKKFYSI